MPDSWIRRKVTAELLADAHFGTGAGGGGIDALVARDRQGRPVIWASHVEGVLRDAARRLRGNQTADDFFGRAGGVQQRAIFTSLYTSDNPESRIWRSAARQSFENRAPKDDTMRAIEYVPKGTRFVGEVELPERDLPLLQRLVQEVDALGSGRASGAGRLTLSLEDVPLVQRDTGLPATRLKLLLRNRDPLCITATATPDNLIPSLAFVPGRALLGTMAAWLVAEGDHNTASLLTSGRILVSDALPLPQVPPKLDFVEILPAPLSLQSEKPKGLVVAVPWWAQPKARVKRIDAWTTDEKLKRPEDDLFVYRTAPSEAWMTFRPARRVRLRNGRPDSRQADASLFAIEQIVEETHFLAEISGSLEEMQCLARALAPVLQGQRWLRVGRAGAPVEVERIAWLQDTTNKPITIPDDTRTFRLTLTSDLLVRDDLLRWRAALDETALQALVGTHDLRLKRSIQDWVVVHGFNGTSRLWRMPAAAIRRGSVFEVSGSGVAELARRAAQGQWLGERTHEGFGRFRFDEELPGVTSETDEGVVVDAAKDVADEVIAAQTHAWFENHRALAIPGGAESRKPSLSQWFDLVADLEADLERGNIQAIGMRLKSTTAGARSWKHKDAEEILNELRSIPDSEDRARHARFFVRWLRAAMREGVG